MSDLIKREDAIEAINKALDRETLLYGLVRKIAVDAIKITPSADRPQGEWIWRLADNGWADHICSVCGYRKNTDIHVSLNWRYCPNCGARMKGADDEADNN